MKNYLGSDDDDEVDRSSPMLRTQRFPAGDTLGSKGLSSTLSRPKPGAPSKLNIDLKRIGADDGDSLDDSDEDTNTKTGRSTSSGGSSHRMPQPKERSFLKRDNEKPKTPPRRFDVDDDDRDVFGQGTMKPSPRQRITTVKEDEEEARRFTKGFSNDKKRQSPTDMFSADRQAGSRKSSVKSVDGPDSDEESLPRSQPKGASYVKSHQTPIGGGKPASRKSSTTSRDDRSEQSDDDDDDDDDNRKDNRFSHKPVERSGFRDQRLSSHELEQTVPTDNHAAADHHQLPSSRPGSASKTNAEATRRSSYCEEPAAVIPPATQTPTPSRPASAKSNTTRQQTQSAIDDIASANMPQQLDPLTANNEALAAVLKPSLPPAPPPRPSASLPPRPKSNVHASTTGSIHKKSKNTVSNRYKDIPARVDDGRNPAVSVNVLASVQRALAKEIASKNVPRPQTARVRARSASSERTAALPRPKSASAYKDVKPRVNTNLSINCNERSTSRLQADSSQTIVDGVYNEWLKEKDEERKEKKAADKQWKEERSKRVDAAKVERQVQQSMQTLERWREERDAEAKRKRAEELAQQREKRDALRREREEKRKIAVDGFDNWKQKKDEELIDKREEERDKKAEIEKLQEEEQKKVLEAATAYSKWNDKKAAKIKKMRETQKLQQQEQLKKLRETQETKFVEAQGAYEKWLENKEKQEVDEKLLTQRRNSFSSKKQQQVPFLPGGGQKNTGRVEHVAW